MTASGLPCESIRVVNNVAAVFGFTPRVRVLAQDFWPIPKLQYTLWFAFVILPNHVIIYAVVVE